MDKVDEKIIIMNGFTREEIREIIDWYKKNKNLPPVIFASVTEHSIEWKLGDLLKELIKEDKEIKRGLSEKNKTKGI